ncbi:MAG: 1,4-dihydroxy-2-naphthoate polyprenyltransferase [Coriobacteriia bacterium]|nr:1,4-dihydroxy-2-naphthoate polyprenyltransferase [Coriobacteriia bacterium]
MTPPESADTSSEAEVPGPLRTWWLAIRPKTLPAAASGVIVGTVLAWRDGGFALGPALAALVVAVLLQIASNLANDVYDDERGADTAERLGPLRVTQAGLLRRDQVKRGMKVVLVLAFAAGLYLTYVRGWVTLVIGLAAIVSAIAYTGGPYPLGYHGLGEVFVFVFFGLAAVVGTYWVQTGSTTPLVWLMAVPPGLIVTAIIIVNNLRDIEQDRVANKRTIAVRVGAPAAKVEYAVCLVVAYALVAALVAVRMLPLAALATWFSAPLAIRTARIVYTRPGRALNAALASTGQIALIFSVLFALSMLLP